MRFFKRFEPRLVGAVLDGTADKHSAICLHLFNDTLEEVTGFLQEQGIPYEEQTRPPAHEPRHAGRISGHCCFRPTTRRST